MRFYPNSTTNSSEGGKNQSSSPTIPVLVTPTTTPLQPLPLYFCYFNNYCTQFMHLSNLLNQELIKNNSLILARSEADPLQVVAEKEGGRSEEEGRTTDSNKNTSQFQEPPIQIKQQQKQREQKIITKRRRRVQSEEEESYKPDHQDSKEIGIVHVSQSKNIPKNYGKAIVNYIYRNEQQVRRMLLRLKIDFEAFMSSLGKIKKNLNTIMQLRSLWLDEDNPFAQAYRMLTMEYLRKHCLPYIFNSRVQNFHKHIKYRYKMIEGVTDPQRFTHMKQF